MNTTLNAENNKYDAKMFIGLNFFNTWQIIFLVDIFLYIGYKIYKNAFIVFVLIIRIL